MKKYRYIGLMLASLFAWVTINAQGYIGGKPYSYDKELSIMKTNKTKDAQVKVTFNEQQKFLIHDKTTDSLGHHSFRFGYSISVSLNLNNSGEWLYLANGDRIWRLTVYCPNAKSISFQYDKFWIPQGSSLYVYNANKTNFLGGYTLGINNGTKDIPNKFATGIIKSEKVVIEYYEPKEVINQGIISISNIIYGYRSFEDIPLSGNGSAFNDSDSHSGTVYRGYLAHGPNYGDPNITCEVDVNTADSKGHLSWQTEKTSVAKLVKGTSIQKGIIQNGGSFCTGSLMNNTNNDGKLYFLTANHCLDADADPANGTQDENWVIYWNYETTANNVKNAVSNSQLTNDTNTYVTYGATVVANSYPVGTSYTPDEPDFGLLVLKQSPYDVGFKAYYNGWSILQPAPTDTLVGIHHPSGNPKKISKGFGYDNIYKNPMIFSSEIFPYWFNNSIIWYNSSGSPLYNASHQVIGHLHGGHPISGDPAPSNICKNDTANQQYGFYYTLNDSWSKDSIVDCNPNITSYCQLTCIYYTKTNKYRLLQPWLDPAGFLNPSIAKTSYNGMTCYPHIISQNYTTGKTETWCQIQASNVIISNNSSVIFNAANGVYIPASFEVQKGSSFEVQLNK